jgi:hypothetical protein
MRLRGVVEIEAGSAFDRDPRRAESCELCEVCGAIALG